MSAPAFLRLGRGVGPWTWAVLIAVFLVIWAIGMAGSIAAGGCVAGRNGAEQKLRACNVALTAGFYAAFIPADRAEMARIHLERGIALAVLGRDGAARTAFAVAYRDAAAAGGDWLKRLDARIDGIAAPRLRGLWRQASGRT